MSNTIPAFIAQAEPAADQPPEPAAEGAEPVAAEQEISDALNQAKSTSQDALSGDTQAMLQLVQDYALPVIWALLILVSAYVISKIAGSTVKRSLNRARVDETLSRFFGKMASYTVLVFGVIFALSKFGIDVTSFAAILAAAGFAVGMALSGTLSNFAAGVLLLIFRPFKVGDYVVAGGTEGTVEEIELFTTTLNTLDNRHIILPNSLIHGAVIENVTYNKLRRVDVNVGVDYGANMKDTRRVLTDGIASIPGAVADPAPEAYLVDLGDSSVNWQVRVWCAPADYWGVRQALTEAAKDALDAAGIAIPFPQMDVHLDKLEG